MAKLVTVLRERSRIRARTSGARGFAAYPGYSLILIVLDDIGVEWLDYHGVGEVYATGLADSDEPFQYFKTPRLTALANGGAWFSEFYSTHLCSTSRVRLMTGKRTDEVGIGSNIRGPGTATSATTYPTTGYAPSASHLYLAEHLRAEDSDIATGFFGKTHVPDVWSTVGTGGAAHTPDANLTFPATMGFQEATWGPLPMGGRYTYWKIVNGTPTHIDGEGTSTFTEATHADSVFTAAATTWIGARTTRFFAVVNLNEPHNPCDVPPFTLLSSLTQTELTGRGLAAGDRLAGSPDFQTARNDADFYVCLRAGAEAMDTCIGRVVDSIPAALRPTTHVMVVSDNGGTSAMTPEGFSANAKGTLTRGGTNVTCVVYGPLVARPGRQVRTLCDIGDVYATIADIMGHPRPVSGVSFLPALRDAVDRDDPQAIKPYSIEQAFFPIGETNPANFVASSRQRSITDGRWRLIVSASETVLYDTRGDPLELTNLYGDDMTEAQSEAYARLLAALEDELPA